MGEKRSCGEPVNRLNMVGFWGLGLEEKVVIRQEDRKMLREENSEKDEQLQLLSCERKMKRYSTVLTLKPEKDQLFLAMILVGEKS